MMRAGINESGKRVLLVANPGGHLQQLCMIDERLPFTGERLWITADSAQARSLLADKDTRYLPNVASRDYRSLCASLYPGLKTLRSADFEAVISTGSGMALSVLPAASAMGIPTHYIESATRTKGASRTGAILQRWSRIKLYTQHEQWAGGRWSFAGSVFDGFERADQTASPIKNVVVSLGTQNGYGFRRLLDRLVHLLPTDANVLWQTGSTDTTGLPIDAQPQVAAKEMDAAIGAADLVVAHAGTGIALTSFLAGKSPVLVPRDRDHGEHVDNHQTQTAELLSDMELAVVRKLETLDLQALEQATSYQIIRKAKPATFALFGSDAATNRVSSS